MSDKSNSLRERDSFYLIMMVVIIIAFFGRIIFTDQIIRASDVVTQFFWGAKAVKEQSLLQFFQGIPAIFHAGWETLSDGGRTLEGGWNAINLLFHRYFIQHYFPFPSSIAWLAVCAMCWGAIGTFLYCRQIGTSRLGSAVAGLLYVICTENSSLINAGHIQKLEAICWFPWVFLFMERGVRSGRFFHYAMVSLMLALQFFHMHWQISFYSCLAVGSYWLWFVGERFREERGAYGRRFRKDFLLAIALLLLFFTTTAMSFAPLYSWSQQSERGEAVGGTTTPQAGGAPAQKGIGYDEGMSWSMPPEEILSYIVPGLFGYSRQEGGDVPVAGQVYYWGRMRFTQTSDYLGLLPWLLLPLPFLYRRDRITRYLAFLMGATLIMALGKYTFVYRFMFEHLPAFSSFRVPKMILFLFAFGGAVLAGRGIDVLADRDIERSRLRWWLWWCVGVTLLAGGICAGVAIGRQSIATALSEFIMASTRYQEGQALIGERMGHMFRESVISCGLAAGYLVMVVAWYRKKLPTRLFLPLLLLLLLGDLWRVNTRFLVVAPPPAAKGDAVKNDMVTFLKPRIGTYRMQPMNGENAHFYADNGFANVSAYVTISERRYKQFLDGFALMGPMPDIMNLKYLLMPAADFASQRAELEVKYLPVFSSVNGSVVLENKTVLPKAWLVPSVVVVTDPQQRIGIMAGSTDFRPDRVAIVETNPPLLLEPYPASRDVPRGRADVTRYESDRIVVDAQAVTNSLLVIGEKYYRWWTVAIDGKRGQIVPVDHILRGVYLTPGNHRVEFVFDPLPFKVGTYLTLASFVLFGWLLIKEKLRGKSKK